MEYLYYQINCKYKAYYIAFNYSIMKNLNGNNEELFLCAQITFTGQDFFQV